MIVHTIVEICSSNDDSNLEVQNGSATPSRISPGGLSESFRKIRLTVESCFECRTSLRDCHEFCLRFPHQTAVQAYIHLHLPLWDIIYNELRSRDYLVDVGVIESREMKEGKSEVIRYEVDFIATDGITKYYIQSAYSIPGEEKREHELKSLKKIDDSFRKIIVTGDDIEPYMDDNGFLFVGIFDFLLSDRILA